MGNGCLCCNTRSDLQITLRSLVAERDHGRLPPFRRILIETSGLADPGPILQTFATDRALGGDSTSRCLLAVVDAIAGAETLEWSAEARKQTILADRVIISKSDLAAAGSRDSAQRPCAPAQSARQCSRAVAGNLDPVRLVAGDDGDSAVHAGFVAETEHSDGISSFVMRAKTPVLWQVFARAMETLIALRGPDLLRVKGFLNVAGCKGPVVVQIVQHLAHPPVELAAWPDADRTSRVVFITRNIPERQVALF